MDIKSIYEAFDKIGCLSFTTINQEGFPESRIAHLRGYDDEGIYFMTMYTKSFYRDLKDNGKISLCGLSADTKVSHDEEGMPVFEGGYAIRMSGEAREISIDDLKAKKNPMFDLCIKDHEKYRAMVVFCITKARGDIFDYDFEMIARENKVQRTYFAYNEASVHYRGLHIDTDKCISCGVCREKCSFKAIYVEDSLYSIDKYRCDECGDCYINCPVNAIYTN